MTTSQRDVNDLKADPPVCKCWLNLASPWTWPEKIWVLFCLTAAGCWARRKATCPTSAYCACRRENSWRRSWGKETSSWSKSWRKVNSSWSRGAGKPKSSRVWVSNGKTLLGESSPSRNSAWAQRRCWTPKNSLRLPNLEVLKFEINLIMSQSS